MYENQHKKQTIEEQNVNIMVNKVFPDFIDDIEVKLIMGDLKDSSYDSIHDVIAL